jgi:hypothetical protein
LTGISTQECKYSKNEVDDFTKRVVKVTSPQTVYNSSGQLNFLLARVDSVKILKIHYKLSTSSSKTLCFNNASKIMFILGNDSILKFDYVGDIECAESDVRVGSYGSASYKYEIEGAFLLSDYLIQEYLSKFFIKKIRIYFTDGYVDCELQDIIKGSAFSYTPIGNKKSNPQFYFINFLQCLN